jgi:hypothetical protein
MTINDTNLKLLAATAPPMLCEAVGYSGSARYVGFYWTPCGDEIIYTDGRLSADGDWHAWLVFTRHKSIAPHLEGYNLGSSDEEATHWLLIDRQTHALYVGAQGEVRHTLRCQYTDQDGAGESQEVNASEEITPEDFMSLIESFVEVKVPAPEAIIKAMRKQEALTTELSVWLDLNVSGESS